jgi:hypothetical protein
VAPQIRVTTVTGGRALRRSGRLAAVTAVALVALAQCDVAPAAPARLRTGFTDREAYQEIGADRVTALDRSRRAGASVIRISTGWRGLSPTKPPSSADARNPAWPGYNWSGLDAIVRDVVAEGLQPILTFTGAPDWAEGPGRPAVSRGAPAGTWRPSPRWYRYFAEAAARRYSGSFPDPALAGAFLPRARYWQAWNEPNLRRYLTPQWRKRRGRFLPASPGQYRRLLNAFYRGVKAAHRTNFVVSAGLAPFGDPKRGEDRIQPAYFARELLCIRNRRRLRPFRCPNSPVRFDAFGHHPYSLGNPRRRALNADDVTIPDLRKLTRVLRAAVRAGKVRPRHSKQLWVTEISWDTRPPDPDGLPGNVQARYLQESFYLLWRQGVDVVTWFLLRDEAPGQGYQYSYQSGIYYRGTTIAADQPKPSYTAFRFPFTAIRSGQRARLWGLAPVAGSVVVEANQGGTWTQVATLQAGRGRTFSRRLRVSRGTVLRARQGNDTSLPWRVR